MKIQPINLKISTADKTFYKCLGYVNIPYTIDSTTKVIPTVVVPEISKPLILGVDFLHAFGYKLSRGEITQKDGSVKVPEFQINSIDICFIDTYFDDKNLFSVTISPKQNTHQEEVQIIEEDESLNIPTIEIPDKKIETPEDLITEHDLTLDQRHLLFNTIMLFPITEDNKLGRTHVLEHKIELLPDSRPKKVPIYRQSLKKEEGIEQDIQRMLKLGVIEECVGPADFLNPILAIKKPNNKWRICLDSRRLNACTKKDDFPFPDMVGILQRIQKSRYFSIIDLSESYYQVPLEEESKNKTAFRTSRGLYRFTVMPFGLSNAPATMTRLMTKVLGHDLEPFVHVYLDDIVIVSNSFDEHLRLISIVANRLRNANLTINILKSKFCQKRIKYLGYILSEDGLSVDSSKIQPVLDYPEPKNIKDIRRLLGLAGFYRRFIPNYSDKTAKISDLLKKGKQKFKWTKEANDSFLELKSALVSAPILANPDFSLPFTIETDSSDQAIGAVLIQNQNNERKVIAYYSKKLSSTQRKYSATERECLGVLLSIENFRHFVEGTQFVIMTDAMSLTFLKTMSIESKSPRIARWALKLAQYEIDLQYKKGSENITADALSRTINSIKTQLVDEYTDSLREQVTKYPEKYKDFRLVDGKLFKFISNTSSFEDPSFKWKYVVPLIERIPIIKQIHNEAHLGFIKTLAKIREKNYWPKMSTDIKSFCNSCQVCKESKVDNVNPTPLCGKPKECSRPWEMISIDFLGPYPRSKNGNIWALVVSDFFSKFVMIQCMRSATAGPVCSFLENNIFLLFGAPHICISDNATVFKSREFKKLLDKYEICHWNLAVYHPGPNPTERVNRIIVTSIRCALNEATSHREWDRDIQIIAKAIRTAVHDSTGFSPYFMNFGKNMISLGSEYDQLREFSNEDEYTPPKLDERTTKLCEIARKNMKKAYERYSKNYNLRANSKRDFAEGQTVFKKNINLSSKDKNWVGKFASKYTQVRIKKKVGSNTYVLEDMNGKLIPGTYHGSFLKKA